MESSFIWFLLVIPSSLMAIIVGFHFGLHYDIKCNRCICCHSKDKLMIKFNDDKCNKLCKYFCIVGNKGPRFYPTLFLIQLLISLMLCFMVIIRFIITGDTHKYCSLNYVSNHKFIFNAKPLHENTTIHNDFRIIDHVIIYLFIYVLLSDLYFYFYRYYSTLKTLYQLQSPTNWFVFKRFSVFAILFALILVLQMYYYIMFFIIPILMLIFNVYCSWRFSNILLKHYEAASLDGMHTCINIYYSCRFSNNSYIYI